MYPSVLDYCNVVFAGLSSAIYTLATNLRSGRLALQPLRCIALIHTVLTMLTSDDYVHV